MRICVSVRIIGLALISALFAGCGGSADGGHISSSAGSTSSIPAQATEPNRSFALQLSGTAATTAMVGQPYSFTPAVNDAEGTVTFSIKNAPAWMYFSASTGQLTGTPQAADAGTDSNIVISANDSQSTASLSAFSVTVNESDSGPSSATLTWNAPTTDTDGSTPTNLAGYKVYYGTSSNALNNVLIVPNNVSGCVVSGLSSGTWYFAVRSYTSIGTESDLSNVVSKAIA